MTYECIGIDPASGSKGVAVFDPGRSRADEGLDGVQRRGDFLVIKPESVKGWLRARAERASDQVLVAWDAPLFARPWTLPRSTAKEISPFWERPIEAWWRLEGPGHSQTTADTQDRLKGVKVAAFAYLSYWSLTTHVFGSVWQQHAAADSARLTGLGARSITLGDDGAAVLVVEVHPAVTAAMLLADVPVYKGNDGRTGCLQLRKGLMGAGLEVGRPPEFPKPLAPLKRDDYLDAWLAWVSARHAANGTASLLGHPEYGGFVVPPTPVGRTWVEDFATWQDVRPIG